MILHAPYGSGGHKNRKGGVLFRFKSFCLFEHFHYHLHHGPMGPRDRLVTQWFWHPAVNRLPGAINGLLLSFRHHHVTCLAAVWRTAIYAELHLAKNLS